MTTLVSSSMKTYGGTSMFNGAGPLRMRPLVRGRANGHEASIGRQQER
jgi:hypothetical protein